MRRFFTLLARELSAFYFSPIAYVVLFFFLILNGLSFWFALALLGRGPSELTLIQAFFNTLFFWIAYLLVFPVITMRLFAEEFKLGTIETLMTAPVRDWEVVASKYLAALIFYLSMWLPSILYFLIFSWLGNRSLVGTGAQIWGPYLLLLAMGMFNVSLGCLASSLTSNQIIAAMMGLVFVLGTFFLTMINYIINSSSPLVHDLTAYVAQLDHMESFSRGIIDTRPLVFYPTFALLVLVMTYHVFQYRRWKL
ncbi:MAG: gliding motility-associated transport system permease protein [Verrucomicrobiota bacterium]|jgi:ABC-2 type transport system permease protein